MRTYRSAPAFDLHVKVPTVDCQDTVDALVPPFAPMLTGMQCTGTMSFRVELSLDTADMKSMKFEFDPVLRNIKIRSLGRYIDFDVLNMPFEHHADRPTTPCTPSTPARAASAGWSSTRSAST